MGRKVIVEELYPVHRRVLTHPSFSFYFLLMTIDLIPASLYFVNASSLLDFKVLTGHRIITMMRILSGLDVRLALLPRCNCTNVISSFPAYTSLIIPTPFQPASQCASYSLKASQILFINHDVFTLSGFH